MFPVVFVLVAQVAELVVRQVSELVVYTAALAACTAVAVYTDHIPAEDIPD